MTERDVSRTDRHTTFFSGDDNPGLVLLHDVLMTYCMYNFDLGMSHKKYTLEPPQKMVQWTVYIFHISVGRYKVILKQFYHFYLLISVVVVFVVGREQLLLSSDHLWV